MNDFFNKFRDRFIRFMFGRNGTDDIFRFCSAFWMILFIINLFAKNPIINLIVLLLIIYSYFRMLSKNITKRRAENTAFMNKTEDIRRRARIAKLRFRDRKTHIYRYCPVCKKCLRLPKRKGKHTVNCPQCKNDFNV